MSFLRNLRGVTVFSGLTINTIFWFIPIFVLALVKLILPVPVLRRIITRVLMSFGDSWVSLNRYILAGGGSMQWQATGTESLSRDGWYHFTTTVAKIGVF